MINLQSVRHEKYKVITSARVTLGLWGSDFNRSFELKYIDNFA